MTTITVPALRRFKYSDQVYRRGDLVAMSPVDAAVHARRGDVSLTREYRTQVMQAEDPKLTPPRRRRSSKTTDAPQAYERRDLVPEVME